MTLAEKIGQMTLVERGAFNDSNMDEITEYGIGAILSGGGSVPASGNTPKDWADMYDNFQAKALATRLRIPIIYGADAVHGFGNLYGATIFPHHIGLGATREPELVKQVARLTAIETSACGVNWTFGPCVAVPQDDRGGRYYEGFSEDPDLVSILGKAAIEGFQGDRYSQDYSLLACAKHFVGDGGTQWGSGPINQMLDRGNTVCSEVELRATFLPPYIKALEVPVDSIMVSFNAWNGIRVHSSNYLLTQVLKNELQFKGFIVSDWDGIAQIDDDGNTLTVDEVQAGVNAGIDMFMIPSVYTSFTYKDFIAILTDLVNTNRVAMSRIDDAVSRILTVKYKIGVFDKPYANNSNFHFFKPFSFYSACRNNSRLLQILSYFSPQQLPGIHPAIRSLRPQHRDSFFSGTGESFPIFAAEIFF